MILHRARPAAILALVALIGGAAPVIAADTAAPVVRTPTAQPTANGQVQASSVPFTVSWSGSDPSGIRAWRVQRRVDGGSWVTVTLPRATATSVVVGLRPPHEYAFRVRATDTAGNTSSWATAATFRVRRSSEATTALSTTGTWTLQHGTGYLGDRALRSGQAGATATFTFTGKQVAWFGTRGASRGKARVAVDGVTVATLDLHRTSTEYRRIVFRRTWPRSGPHTLRITVLGTTGHPYVDMDGLVVVDPPAANPVLVGAGDISRCDSDADSATARLLDGIAGRVFAAGDNAYPSGSSSNYRDCYGPTWGRWTSRTSPVPGNHEYETRGAAGYFAWFGARAGDPATGWYAYDLGTWRVYSLNSNCADVGCGPTSNQVAWLKADLGSHPRACVAAVWHHPRFSSGEHGNSTLVADLWKTLEAAGAELVLNGHDHDYERFAPQTADGAPAADGLREFVVGTGGTPLRAFGSPKPNSVVRSSSAHGVLKLTLRAGAYDWAFVPVAGESFTDRGSGTCH